MGKVLIISPRLRSPKLRFGAKASFASMTLLRSQTIAPFQSEGELRFSRVYFGTDSFRRASSGEAPTSSFARHSSSRATAGFAIEGPTTKIILVGGLRRARPDFQSTNLCFRAKVSFASMTLLRSQTIAPFRSEGELRFSRVYFGTDSFRRASCASAEATGRRHSGEARLSVCEAPFRSEGKL